MSAASIRSCAWFAALGMAVAAPAALGAEGAAEEDKGWQPLLGEKLSDHWMTTGNWELEDGVVTLTPRPGEKGWSRWSAYLWSETEYDDFEIVFDWRVEKGGNSGFYFNVGDRDDPVRKGIEVQIYDSHGKGDKKKLSDHDAGGTIPGKAPTKNAARPAGQWNRFHITVKGDRLTVKLNGEVVNDLDLKEGRTKDRPEKGYIGFQDHAHKISLKEIKVREL